MRIEVPMDWVTQKTVAWGHETTEILDDTETLDSVHGWSLPFGFTGVGWGAG
ncbi:hypothetical protein [Streptomyces sp. N50]|uniref:hypothetical protein n=1 Tax=Streptomyces sp. N50 TaxID=3081765 RepID=UPI0029621E27|nr:hypothetical protein [Streptomyces sp. N50]WOX13517.1 hypothetical protein R2B38_33895 [Streptomyces sp. N50]